MDVYQTITQKIIDQLEAGAVPWQKPWRASLPKNLISKKSYRGINLLILCCSGFSCPYWATFLQIKKTGGSVNKGEKSTPVVFWDPAPVNKDRKANDQKKEETPGKTVPTMRHFNIFNLEQTSGIKLPKDAKKTKIDPLTACEKIVDQMPGPPAIAFDGGAQAYYRPPTDSVHLPRPSSFNSVSGYYSTLFHELVHSTGHKSRLNRPGFEEMSGFGTEQYSKEELIAEIGAAFLCGIAGIEKGTIGNSTAYIQNWLQVLNDDNRLVVVAAGMAQKAADYVCGGHPSRA